MKNNVKGILGLITIVAGALGVWKYNKMTPEEKASLKDKARKAGDTLKESYTEVEDQVSEKLTSLRNALERETSKANNTLNRKSAQTENVIVETMNDIEEAAEKQDASLV